MCFCFIILASIPTLSLSPRLTVSSRLLLLKGLVAIAQGGHSRDQSLYESSLSLNQDQSSVAVQAAVN